MRILMNTNPIAFQCVGGGEIQLLNTAKALQEIGVEVSFFDPWKTKITEFDIVHYFTTAAGSELFCKYVKSLGLPLVISPILWIESLGKNDPIGEVNTLLNISDLISINSQSEIDNIEAFMHYKPIKHEKFHVTYNACADHIKRPVSVSFSKHYGITKPFVLVVANIDERKNIASFIEVMKRFTEFDLVLIGQVRDNDYFNRLAIESNPQVKYIGYLDNHSDLLISAYRECHLFALPSFLETPGIVAIEACANQAKLLITEVGATKEYFGEEAVYMNPHNFEDMCAKLKIALYSKTVSSPDVSRFTWQNTALQLKEGYQKIV